MKNGELKAFKHAQTIIEYALTAAEPKASHTARQLTKGTPSLKWYQQVETLRKYMLHIGLVLDDAFWKMPIKPPASMFRKRKKVQARVALAGTGGLGNNSFWEGAGGDIFKTIGVIAVGAGVFYGLYWMATKDAPRKKPKRSYKKFPGLVGAR